MRVSVLTFAMIVFASYFVASQSLAGPVRKQEIDKQNANYQRLWNKELVWRYDDLPAKGMVPKFRIPYSGYIYPDNAGGTYQSLRKYDQAFRSRAAAYERWDISSHTTTRRVGGGGLFGFGSRRVTGVPHWAGHCNGWTAAAIRHAEPQKNVTRNGVTFTPADIKGLLAELYIYSETEFLGGVDYVINPAVFHVVVANWIGKESHPIGMEITPGREVWNYPLYAYATSSAKRSDGRYVEVKMNVAYSNSTDREHNKAPRVRQNKYFHYLLGLDEKGAIVSGDYYGDSSRIDMLWAPLKPTQGGKKGNERGNPHLNADEIIALWRDSVDGELRDKWVNIDVLDKDQVLAGKTEEPPADPNVDTSANTNPGSTASEAGTERSSP